MEQDFARIRTYSSVFMYAEQRLPSKGGQQYLLRVLKIFPYQLDEHLQPHRLIENNCNMASTITWRDLLCRPWYQLIASHRLDNDD